MNYLLRKMFSLLSLSISFAFINRPLTNELGYSDCCGEECFHNHLHEENDDLKSSFEEIIDLPSKLVFGLKSTNSIENYSDNYGTYSVKANYQPEGCLNDTVWSSSNPDVVAIDVDSTDSSIATLICLSPFDNEITITATSKYFSNVSYSCNCTYEEEFEILPTTNEISLTGTRIRNCPGKAYSFYYDNQISLTSLFTMNKDVEVSYEFNGTGVVISGNYIRMSSAISSSSGVLTIKPVGYENKAITIRVFTSYTSESGEHNYIRSIYKASYKEYGDWITSKEATCVTDGEEKRPVYTYSTRYKYTCSYCNEYYFTGGTKSTAYEYRTINSFGHNYVIKENSKSATCTKTGKNELKECNRCGDQIGGEIIPKTAHIVNQYNYYYCKNCGSSNAVSSHCNSCMSANTGRYGYCITCGTRVDE